MNEKNVRYVRKLSGEEATKRFILVLKESLKLFPKPGIPFTVKIDGNDVETEIKLNEVWNQGSRNPSLEYHIDLSKNVDLFRPHFGQTVTLTKIDDQAYELK